MYSESITSIKTIFGYAYDLILISKCDSTKEINNIKKVDKKLTRTIKHLNLDINRDKTKYMIFGSDKKLELKINGKNIERVKSFMYLGVWFDENNTFNTNTKEIIKKTNRRSGTLRFLLNKISGTSSQIGLNIYKRHLRPLLEYASNIVSYILRDKGKKLESLSTNSCVG